VRAVLIDTGPLYALAVPSDQYHERAYREWRDLKREHRSVMTPYPTVFETYSLLLRRLTPERAHTWLHATLEQVGLLTPNAQDYHSAALRPTRYRDQAISLYDALLVVLGERLDVPIWTFDADMDVMGAEVWRRASGTNRDENDSR
jgi:predicted nucleic acid-binding protein